MNVPARSIDSEELDSWHLAREPREIELTEFEFSLERIVQAFYRWKSECLAAVAGGAFSGHDTAVLNVIRMKEQPKRLSEIARLLNRGDTSNIQYALRKLLNAGLIEMVEGGARKTATYRVTKAGHDVTEAYARLRRETLIALTGAIGDHAQSFADTGRFLDIMAGMYDQAAGKAAAERY